ncbi:peptidase T [Acetobacter sp. DsW_063]|uniref:peptidase T n=1 Tax=Acetobacter sp. DsW_063 TaxID=1514894 RepID=UPI000A36CD28|nr:peptidase T [Acetobacter sp. DsW_063]OUJ12587.1 peptidase T [Acetobacter sp. DsW_063]
MPHSGSRLLDRFLRYVAIPSQSSAQATVVPSSDGQWTLASLLRDELNELGLKDVHLDEHCVLTAHLPANGPATAPRIGFCAHLDTVDVGLSPEMHPQILRYDGQDICLNPERDIWLLADEHPELTPHIGQDVVFTDGTSVLGADNKAAVAIVMDMLETVIASGTPHGDVFVAFVPDEEIGLRGAKIMNLERFPAEFAYTVDACASGEFVYETFNAAQAKITIDGVTAHPMAAKGVLVNPILVATDLIARFDPHDTPEHTEGREGYCWVNGFSGDQATARLSVSIRDFDRTNFEKRKVDLQKKVAATLAAFPRAAISCVIADVYSNIASAMGNDRRCIALLEEAFAACGITPNVIPMRGGTDGSALSARGIPTPNYFTGGLNFHSIYECLPLPAFAQASEVTLRLVTLAVQA